MVTLSLIIPTFNESKTLPILCDRITRTLDHTGTTYEIWFVDDSSDDTPIVLAALCRQYSQIHYIHRENTRGLGSAVALGFKETQGKWLIVMDADLQHPPEYLPRLIEALQNGADIVIPSRFIPGGSDGGLNIFRRSISFTARMIGRCLIQRLRCTSDCTSGFFGVNRAVIDNAGLVPESWKILMEILVKGHWQTLKEIPYPFQARCAGESKMSLREQWQYLKHVFALARYERTKG